MTTAVSSSRPRTEPARVRVPDRARPVVPRRRFAMVGACYAGLGMIVLIAMLLRQVAPTALAVPLFLLAAVVLVGMMHPRRSSTRRTLRS